MQADITQTFIIFAILVTNMDAHIVETHAENPGRTMVFASMWSLGSHAAYCPIWQHANH